MRREREQASKQAREENLKFRDNNLAKVTFTLSFLE